jgi:hypothetical protein
MKNFIEEFIKVKNDFSFTHKIFKNAMVPTPSIKPFIDYIEFSKKAGNYRSDTEGLYVLHTDPYVHDLSSFGDIQNLKEKIRNIYAEEIDMVGITLIISEYSMNNIEKITGITKHHDPQDTLHWACVGNSLWHIYNKDTNELEFEYILEPGDIFFTRKGTIHEVSSISPRSACILTMHKNGETVYGEKQL